MGAKLRRFKVWAEVREGSCTVEMPISATDAECEAACKEALDVLISNGDTGWNEVDENGEVIMEPAKAP